MPIILPETVNNDTDLKALAKGSYMLKLTSHKKLKQRFYRFDFSRNELVGNTKKICSRIQKIQPTIEFNKINEVKKGLTTKDQEAFEHLSDKAFVLYYNDHRKNLTLIAEDKIEQERWVDKLLYLIQDKRSSGINQEHAGSHFKLADQNKTDKLSKTEIEYLFKQFNVGDKSLKKLIRIVDTDGDQQLDLEEFTKLYELIYKRTDIEAIFMELTNMQPIMTLQQFRDFISSSQNEGFKTEDECKEIIDLYELKDEALDKRKSGLSLHAFTKYLMDEAQELTNPKSLTVYQNMTLPVTNYFINSSHNTYLGENQVYGENKADSYRVAIMKGARLVELDVFDGDDNRPVIYHGNTMVSKIDFESVIILCKQCAHEYSEYPLILTLELHAKEQLTRVAEILKEHLGGMLFKGDLVEEANGYPSPELLKGNIIIRCKKSEDLIEADEDEDLELTESTLGFTELNKLMQSAKFKGIDYGFDNYKQHQTSSLSEITCQKLIDDESSSQIIKYTDRFMMKVYPAYYRQDSSNLNPLDFWSYGFQIVALNFQTYDTAMKLNQALFEDNGRSGFVLKPEILRSPSLGFDPKDPQTMHNKKKLRIRIISAQQLPLKYQYEKIDPFVSVKMHGVPADTIDSRKTKSIKNNGHNPIWNEGFEFLVNCPELAFIEFKVKDRDRVGKDDLIGIFVIRFEAMRSGYRHLSLRNKSSQGTLFVHVNVGEPSEPIV